MDIKDIKFHLDAEENDRLSKPWYIRTFLGLKDNLYYGVFLDIKDFKQRTKWMLQRLTKGYCDKDVWNLNSYIINRIYGPLKEFVKHEEEEGISLPKEFETDPAAWLAVLKKIEFAVDDYWRDENDDDYLPYKNLSADEITDYIKRVDEGFELLGKYMRNMWN